MVFTSFPFLFFFLTVWLAVRGLNRHASVAFRNVFLLLACWFFYGSFRVDFLFWLLWVTISTYGGGLAFVALRPKYGRAVTAGAVFLTLLPLLLFKYSAFFCSILFALCRLPYGAADTTPWLLPVGMSFFTFQALGYIIDLYRGKVPVEKNFFNLALFVAFFPTVLSGPIENARNLLPQFRRRQDLGIPDLAGGGQRFLWGLFKKVVVADRLADYVDMIYAGASGYSGKTVAFAALCYTMQIYCDFSGYSDMAIGAGRALGFRLSKNFDNPYFAVGIRDFWKRWHITLTRWFTEYLYISCGGNRVSRLRWIGNIMLVFAVSGLWHGASWCFVVWGALHGGFYLLDHVWQKYGQSALRNCWGRWGTGVMTFGAVTFAWIFFRSTDLCEAWGVLRQIVCAWDGVFYSGPSSFSFVIMVGCTVFVAAAEACRIQEKWHDNIGSALQPVPLLFSVVLIWAVELLAVSGKQFVYFLF